MYPNLLGISQTWIQAIKCVCICLCDECVQCSTVIISSPQIHLYVCKEGPKCMTLYIAVSHDHRTCGSLLSCSFFLSFCSPLLLSLLLLYHSTGIKFYLTKELLNLLVGTVLIRAAVYCIVRIDFPNSARILNE